jgi:ankyrin repeat protein
MSGLLQATCDGDLNEMQRLIGEGASVHEVGRNGLNRGWNALMYAILHDHAHIVHWLVKEGGARIFDADEYGRTALSNAVYFGSYGLVQWLLEEGGANITDTAVIDGEYMSVWDHFNFNELASGLQSLLKVMVLLGDAPPDFISELSPRHAHIVMKGRRIRALRSSYLEQQRTSIETNCNLPAVLQSIVVAYAEPTPEDMWTDWAQWM